ncbi:MAG: hypothetical protein IH820_15470 [Bacteroidetes bacterium]|nr:hypothetical protein [Bacteroidota bacterium]
MLDIPDVRGDAVFNGNRSYGSLTEWYLSLSHCLILPPGTAEPAALLVEMGLLEKQIERVLIYTAGVGQGEAPLKARLSEPPLACSRVNTPPSKMDTGPLIPNHRQSLADPPALRC